MKGLILSGGHGVRLRPITYSQQKQLIPVANKPILFYCIEDLINSGISEIAIIVGPNKEQVMDTVRSTDWDAELEFIYQDAPRGLAHAVKLSRDFMDEDKFVMYLGDNLLRGGSAGFIRDFDETQVDASLLLTEVDDPSQYGVALVDEQNKVIKKLIEKPKNPPSNLSIVGIYGLTPIIFDAIESISPSWRGELEITDALHWLIENGYTVRYQRVSGWWKDTGQPRDILDANRLVLESLESVNEGTIDGGSINGRVAIGKGSVLRDTTVEGPAIIGNGCVLSCTTIGPFTSIGDNCTICDAEIADSIVMNETCITNVRGIRESLIGRHVNLQVALKACEEKMLFLGDNSQVIL